MKIVIDSVKYLIEGSKTTVVLESHVKLGDCQGVQNLFKPEELIATTVGKSVCNKSDTYDIKKGKQIARTKAYYKACKTFKNRIIRRYRELHNATNIIDEYLIDPLYERMGNAEMEYAEASGIDLDDLCSYENPGLWVD